MRFLRTPAFPAWRRPKGGWASAIIALIVDYTTTQFTFKFKLPSTNTVTLHWGDGTSEEVTGQDGTIVTKTSSYSVAGTYRFWLSGDVEEITYIDVNSQTFVSGDVSKWTKITSLTYIKAYTTGLYGNIENYNSLPLTYINFNNCINITGELSNLSTLSNCGYFGFSKCNVSFENVSAFTNDGDQMALQDNNFTSQEADNIIASLKTCTDCIININGANAHRTAASNDDLNTLLANGNTITLNDVLGDELYTGLNAANDNATEAITAFADYAATIEGATKVTQGQDISKMLPLGDELLAHPALDADDWSKDAGWTYDGGDDEYDCDGTNDADLYITEANDDGKYYLLEITTTNYNSGSLKARYGESDWFTLSFTGNEALSVVIRKEVTSDVLEIRSVNYNGSISDISLKEIKVLGDDLVTNGDFAADTDWTKAGTVPPTIGGGVLSFAGDGWAYQDYVFDQNDWYLAKYTVSNYVSGAIAIQSSVGGVGEIRSANGTYVELFQWEVSSQRMYLRGIEFTGDIDNVSVHKLTVTKEITDSTNYTGTHYILPEEGEDLDSFIIPVNYVAEGISDQKITGEYNATTGWTAANNAVLSVEETNVNEGLFAIEIESNTTPTADADADIDITVENGEVYRLEVDHRHVGSGDDWILKVEGTTADTLDNTETSYITKVYYFTAGDTTCTIRYKENNVSNNGGIYTDNISFKKVTFT